MTWQQQQHHECVFLLLFYAYIRKIYFWKRNQQVQNDTRSRTGPSNKHAHRYRTTGTKLGRNDSRPTRHGSLSQNQEDHRSQPSESTRPRRRGFQESCQGTLWGPSWHPAKPHSRVPTPKVPVGEAGPPRLFLPLCPPAAAEVLAHPPRCSPGWLERRKRSRGRTLCWRPSIPQLRGP